MLWLRDSINNRCHQIAGFNVDDAKNTYQIPENHEPLTAIAIGYLGDPQSLPEGLRDREIAPRVRKPLQEFVFTKQWGNVSPLLDYSSFHLNEPHPL